jgi:hypothetical protein
MTGACLCKAVTFTADGVASQFSACHCGMCRRWNGGAPYFAVAVASVAFATSEHIGRYESSPWAERGFCTRCGTHLFYFLRPAQRYLMAMGCFDDPSQLTMSREIFIDRKPDGYALSGDHERWTEAETFERLAPK